MRGQYDKHFLGVNYGRSKMNKQGSLRTACEYAHAVAAVANFCATVNLARKMLITLSTMDMALLNNCTYSSNIAIKLKFTIWTNPKKISWSNFAHTLL